jgi:hypothetical protein
VIDFRYHLVSIVAVFLALAVGLLVGSAALRPIQTQALLDQSSREKTTIESLEQQKNLLTKQGTLDDTFGQAVSGRLLSGLLTGQRVVLVEAPGADSSTVSGIAAAVRQAGATVTGEVTLAQQFFDASGSNESNLDTHAQDLAPAGASVTGDSASAEYGQQAAATVIAAALVTKEAAQAGTAAAVTATERSAILNGFAQQGYLQISSGASPQPATLAVVVTPGTPPGNEVGPVNEGIVDVADALRTASSGTVLAGSLAGSGAGSAIDAIASGNISASLTTVDNADSEIGQIIVAQALAELLAGHKPVQYGVASNAVPSPPPSPSPTAATPAQTTPAGKAKPRK